VFTKLVFDRCSPSEVVAVDPVRAQIDYARCRLDSRNVDFRVADAQFLPFADGCFEVVTSALVLNFIADPIRALTEMRRVTSAGGLVAAYLWDFENELSPSGPFRSGLRRFGIDVPDIPGTSISAMDAIRSAFTQARFGQIATHAIDIPISFPNFDAFWRAQTLGHSPVAGIITSLPAPDQVSLAERIRSGLPTSSDGRIEYLSRANAVRACVSN
jgi:SAM-dependent methyltransferase